MPRQWVILDKDVVDEIIFRTENPGNRLILELMARSGMRIEEVLRLRCTDIEDRRVFLSAPSAETNPRWSPSPRKSPTGSELISWLLSAPILPVWQSDLIYLMIPFQQGLDLWALRIQYWKGRTMAILPFAFLIGVNLRNRYRGFLDLAGAIGQRQISFV